MKKPLGCAADQVDAALSAVLHIEEERFLYACRGVGEREEGLVWPRGFLAVHGRELELQRVCGAQRYGLGQRRCRAQPGNVYQHMHSAQRLREPTCPSHQHPLQRLYSRL
jgi:hypothetical protein